MLESALPQCADLVLAPPLPKRPRYFWTMPEVSIVRENYPQGGAAACKALLPNRTTGAIHQQALKLGLRGPNQPSLRQTWRASDAIDAVIVRAYQRPPQRGFTQRIADTVGRPKWWVTKRAQQLGLAMPRLKPSEWSEAEDTLLHDHGHKKPDVIRRVLARHGYNRSTTAIVVRMKRAQVDRTDFNHFTARGLADVMGVDSKTVCLWITRDGLQAKRRGTDRTEAQGGDQWWISRQAMRSFVINNAAAIDLRKIVDPTWFIDLLANRGKA